uniref:Uncharacterized protein n=1 Tax=uncultured prokaryote TaxID=198431 RepID=A0A0H5Q724_9ZZZZ|nr:hypothetical protein [uncultured prokaryote]
MPFDQANHVLVQARFNRELASVPADVVINTFVFDKAGLVTGNGYAEIVERLDTFYYGLTGAQAASVGSYLHNALSGLTYYLRDTDAAKGTPGEEIESDDFTRTSAISSSLPPDVALCVSYRAAPPVTARRRGRIYLGPLRGGSTLVDSDGKLLDAAHDNIVAAAEGLSTSSGSNPVRWVVASRAGNTAADIVSGYVDSSFDTQRRRDPSTEVYLRHPDDWDIS